MREELLWRDEPERDADDFYSQDLIEKLVEQDEITPAEEGFMFGWLEAET